MGIIEIGANETLDIQSAVDRVLRDLENPEPPLDLERVRDVLRLDLKYYQGSDPGAVGEIAHRLRVAGKQLLARPGLLGDAIRKAKLSALWIPDSKRILIDSDVPTAKHRWMEGHEIGHSITPWHQNFLFGDTSLTLDPACHAQVEAEANFAAKELLFLRGRFGEESRDLPTDFKTVRSLAKRYGNTITSTLWRMVEDRNPEVPAFGMVSVHPRHPDVGGAEDGQPVRYFIRSKAFRKEFPEVTAEEGFAILKQHASWSRTGPVVDCEHRLQDARREEREFHVQSFSNSYALLTYGVCK